MVRKVLAVALSFAVQAAAVTAPLVHAHLDNHATEHHSAKVVHSHWAGHVRSHQSSDTPAFDADDHDAATFLNAFVAVAAVSIAGFAAAADTFELPRLVESLAHRGVEVTRSHDPPCYRSLSSRAPPACLS